MADYNSPAWRAALGLPPLHTWYCVHYTDGHVRMFSTELQRAEHLAQCPPGTIADIDTLVIGEPLVKKPITQKPKKLSTGHRVENKRDNTPAK